MGRRSYGRFRFSGTVVEIPAKHQVEKVPGHNLSYGVFDAIQRKTVIILTGAKETKPQFPEK
jgi:hypothetical protein